MNRTEKEKMLAGELYRADSPEIQADQVANMAWLARYNAAIDQGNDAVDVAALHGFVGFDGGECVASYFFNHCVGCQVCGKGWQGYDQASQGGWA